MRRLTAIDGSEQACLPDKLIEQPFLPDQCSRRVKLFNFATVKHDYAVAVKDGIDAMRNCATSVSLQVICGNDLLVMMVRSLNMLLRKVVCSIASVSISTAAVASSRTRMFVGVSRARASDTSCLWP